MAQQLAPSYGRGSGAKLVPMVRSQTLCACVLFVVSPAVGLAPARAQHDDGHEGPAPVDSTQSISAGAYDDLSHPADDARNAQASAAAGSGHSGGAYGGVVPGASNKVSKPAPGAKGPATITWPGFQMRPDGSSRVFIQSTKAIEPKVLATAAGKFELQLPGARVAEKTNRLPLDTRFFNTPVTKVSVNAARSGAVVLLEMRTPVTPQVNSELGPSGYYFTYIELPKGEYLKATGSSANTTSNAPPPPLPPLPTAAKPATKVIGSSATTDGGSAPAHGTSARSGASMKATIKLGH
jgi:hypothetical protein